MDVEIKYQIILPKKTFSVSEGALFKTLNLVWRRKKIACGLLGALQ